MSYTIYLHIARHVNTACLINQPCMQPKTPIAADGQVDEQMGGLLDAWMETWLQGQTDSDDS